MEERREGRGKGGVECGLFFFPIPSLGKQIYLEVEAH